MSDTMDSMLAALGQAGYSPQEEGGLMAELAAYDAVLAPLLQAADHVLQGLFIETADAAQLEKWEKLFCPQLPDTTVEKRRSMLLHRCRVTQDDISHDPLAEHLPAACLWGDIFEQPDGSLLVLAAELFGVTREQATWFLNAYLPAHMAYTLEIAAG